MIYTTNFSIPSGVIFNDEAYDFFNSLRNVSEIKSITHIPKMKNYQKNRLQIMILLLVIVNMTIK